jgi:AbrB family looped-hinge helix DNA binding protein
MSIVRVSSKYQVVIPAGVREFSGLKRGQEVDVVWHDGQIRVLKVPTLDEVQLLCRGMDRSLERASDRPL